MRFLVLWLFIAFSFTQTAIAGEEEEVLSTKAAMRQVLGSYVELIPYMHGSPNQVPEPKERLRVASHIYKMLNAFQMAKHGRMLKNSSLAPLRNNIENILLDIADTHEFKNFLYAKYRLRSFASSCIQCHSQLPPQLFKKVRLPNISNVKQKLSSHFDKGLFLYLLRDYQGAINEFEEEIKLRMKRGNYRNSVERSFRNILSIYTKVLKKPKAALKFFKRYQGKKYIYQAIPSMLNNWIKDLEEWSSKGYIEKISSDDRSIGKVIDETLKPLENGPSLYMDSSTEVEQLFMSGIISNYLIKKPKTKIKPRLLYWLGRIESNFINHLSYSLGDLYLKQCINDYPKNVYGKKCYQVYKENIQLYYTGSRGMELPADVAKELKKMAKEVSE